jgi:hypothetical protein
MEEKFLHYTWKYRLFEQGNLFTTTGKKIELIKIGEHNLQSGPDFFNAQLKIDGELWAGNLEIHVNSSEWNQHGHQHDEAYDNVILHVVYEHDEEVMNARNETIPTLELKGLIPLSHFQRYQGLNASQAEIACGKQVMSPPKELLGAWFERLATERLEEKTKLMEEILVRTKNDWDETLYLSLARNFGFKTNALPFYMLAKSVSLKILLKYADDPEKTEALLFGQAGMLEEQLAEKYPRRLQNEYEFLKNKYALLPLKKSIWKFGRMRPANFPGIRIAQFAALVKNFGGLFSKLKTLHSTAELETLFNAEPSDFWKNHYSFQQLSPLRSKKLGYEGIRNIAINTIVPILFLYGRKTQLECFCEKAIQLLEDLESEQNNVTRIFKSNGLEIRNAKESQALVQLKRNYCEKKQCLSCQIGYHILKS